MWNWNGPFGGHQTQTQENPLQQLLRINQEAGGAVLDALGNIPNVIQEIPGRIQQGADNLLKIGQDSLDQVIETAVEQQEQRKTNLEAGGTTKLTQQLTDSAEMLAEGATGAGWLDLAGVGLMEASGADWMPKPLRLPLLVGGMAVSAADGTPPPLSPKQLKTLSKVSSTAKRLKLTRTDEVLKWIDEGNEFIRETGSQRNWKNNIFTDSDGNQWQLKSQGTGKPYAPRSMLAAARDKAGRDLRENAWKAQLKEALERRGTYTPERYNELEKRVTSGINKMKTHIRNVNKGKPREEWISFGHKKSLAKDGVNVPENVVFEPYLENVSTQHKFDPSDAAVRQSGGPLSVEEWVLQQEILEEFGDILPYRGLPNDLQIKILKTEGQIARDALVEAHLLEKTTAK